MGTLDATFDVTRLARAVAALDLLTSKATGYIQARTAAHDPDVVILAASGFQTECHLPLAAEVHQAGTAVLDCRKLGRLLRALPRHATVRLASEANERVTATTPTLTTILDAPRADLLPALWAPQGLPTGPALTIPVQDLAGALRTVLPSISTDDTRPALAAVQVQAHADGIHCTTADGFTLTTVQVAPPDPAQVPMMALLPRLMVQLLRRALAWLPIDGDLTITLQDQITPNPALPPDLVAVDIPDAILLLALQPAATYPAWRKIIPSAVPTGQVVVSAADLAAAAHLIQATQGADMATLLTATADSDVLLLHATTDDGILTQVAVPCMAAGEGTLSVLINPRFLRRLAATQGAEGWLRIAHGPEPFGPIRFTTYHPEPDHPSAVRHLVMPMNKGRSR